ncbi:MFS transporter [Actinokineospora auranticolor]|uniref:MFS transporter n=1 Tax=Actinokineospora auranticolor TaxID=155976 RepID=A0A2S6GKA7_9PSEU|nr:MFS transporter [Actinokineospora auranticolor]PPK65649.1 MFS transporter [Actinokineospora auranticolor]
MSGSRTRYLVGMAVDATGAGLYLPLSLLYFHHVTGMPIAQVGVVMTAGALFALVGNPIAGTLVDRLGARSVVVGGYVLRAVGFAAYPLVDSATTMFLAVALVAVGDGSFPPSIQALVAEIAEGTARDKLLAAQRSMRNAGLGLGGLAAGGALTIGSDAAYTGIVLATGVAYLAAAVIIGTIPLPARGRRGRAAIKGGYREVFANKPFLALALVNVPIAFGYMVLAVALPVYITQQLHAATGLVGALYAVNTIGIAVLQIPVTRMLVRYRRTRATALGALVIGASFVLFALLGAVSSATAVLLVGSFVATALFTAGELMHGATASALVSSAAPVETRGRHLSVYQFSWAIPTALAPAVLTALLSASAIGMWLVLAAGVVGSAAAMVRLEPRLPADAVRPKAVVTAAVPRPVETVMGEPVVGGPVAVETIVSARSVSVR